MRQLVVFSTAAERQDATTIARIAAISFTNNARDGVTGVLVAGGHRYLQVLEGTARATNATLARIRADRRHVGMTVLVDRPITRRNFSDWSVAFRGEPEFGDFATLADMARDLRARVTKGEVRDQVDCFTRLFVLTPPPPAPSPWTLSSNYHEESPLHRGH